ncbi:sensor histidine kinase [Aliikangiella maris]|uniref:histidine kinase n=2 Tax=Aliikangiella maris TaxID=3162458 RepID=A0ABV2BS34_9GAMM
MSDVISPAHEKQHEDEFQQMVYGISHDLGAPLRSVVRLSQLLQDRVKDKLDEKEKYWLDLIINGGEQAQAMIDGLLTYSRLINHVADIDSVNLTEIIAKVADKEIEKFYQAYIQSARNINFQYESENFVVTGVYHHWLLLIQSIVENATLYQPLDSEQDLNVICTLSMKEQRLILCVEDNGIGVSDEQKKYITRPFMRGQSPQDYPGIGMGLAFCQRIAKINDGELRFEDSPLGGLKVIYSVNVS